MRILIRRKREAKLQSWRYINYFISCCTKHDSTREKHNYLMSNFLGSFDRLIFHTKIGTKPALKIILKLINVSYHYKFNTTVKKLWFTSYFGEEKKKTHHKVPTMYYFARPISIFEAPLVRSKFLLACLAV